MKESQPPALTKAAHKILEACHPAPFEYLGRHRLPQNSPHKSIIRIILPAAVTASIIEPPLPMRRLDDSPIFEVEVNDEEDSLPEHYSIEWQDIAGNLHRSYDPYSFSAQISGRDLELFIAGRLHYAAQELGAHLTTVDDISGVCFATWAPNAACVSVVGDFNQWDNRCHAMQTRGTSGIWGLFIPDLEGGEHYLFDIRSNHSGKRHLRPDPYARQFDTAATNNAIVTVTSEHHWKDSQWLHQRASYDWQHAPISCYEVHLGSWQRHQSGAVFNYRELAKQLIDYVRTTGFTHIVLCADTSVECYDGYFAPDSRHGTPDDFRYFIDHCHQHRIGVMLNWVVDHLPHHCSYLKQFDGAALYELATHNTSNFDYSQQGVRNFLLSSALFWLDNYHIDGLKLRTTTSMLYLDGQQNDDVLSLLREINDLAHQQSPGVLMLADENSVMPKVTSATGLGGLGFSMKWNNSWHHDTLKYMAHETAQRPAHHDALIFNQHYAFNEKFMLPFSHPTEQQDSRALLFQMPGDEPQRFANLRLLYSYMYTYPGKKLLFMGNEFATTSAWNAQTALPWELADEPLHDGLSKMVTELNALYRNTRALYYYDFNEQGFEWIDCHDSSQSLLVFQRKADEHTVIVALNFSNATRNSYRIGVPYQTKYKEIFNSDSYHFGGEERLNSSGILSEKTPWMKLPFSITITLPALSAVILKPLSSATAPTTSQ